MFYGTDFREIIYSVSIRKLPVCGIFVKLRRDSPKLAAQKVKLSFRSPHLDLSRSASGAVVVSGTASPLSAGATAAPEPPGAGAAGGTPEPAAQPAATAPPSPDGDDGGQGQKLRLPVNV